MKSWEAVRTWAPSGAKVTDEIICACPTQRLTSLPLACSQTRALLSQLPVSTQRPSGEKTAEVTRSACP